MNKYQRWTDGLARYPHAGETSGLLYTALGLTEEAGEFAGKLKKAMRDDDGEITPERKKAMVLELGDVLWYAAQCARNLGVTLEEVIVANQEKLESRARRDKIGGSGDNR